MNQQKRGSRFKPRRAIVLILSLACIAAAVGLAAANRETRLGSETEPERLLQVETRVAEVQETYSVERSFVGRVEAARSSDLGFELDGLVERVSVEEGDRVAAGQRLATLDRQRLRSRRGELTAALEEAHAGLELARSTHQRVAEAAGLNAVSSQEHDEARLEVRAREASVQRLEAQIASLDVEIAKSTLRAPYTATISARLVDEGVVLPAGQPVLRLLETGRLEARIGVSPEAAGELEPGQEIDLAVRGTTHPARVKAILPDRGQRTRTVTVLLAFADGTPVRDGDLAEAMLARQLVERGFWLPASALTESVRGLWSCFVAEPEAEGLHRIARRDVEVLHTETGKVFVSGTLADGEKVVSNGVHRLVPGQQVRVQTQGETS